MRARALLSTAVLSCALALAGCDKGTDAGTEAPGDAGAAKGGKGAKKGDGVQVAYPADGFKLRAQTSLLFELSGQQAGGMEMAGSGVFEVVGAGEDRLKVTTTLEKVDSVSFEGALKPKEEISEADIIKAMIGSQDWTIIDTLGEGDSDATKALPEVAKRDAETKAKLEKAKADGTEPEPDFSDFGAQLLSLPGLPSVGLKEGKEVKAPTEEDERNLFGMAKVPMETDASYTLKSIDSSGGTRVATIDFESVGSGATELSAQGQTMLVSVDVESSGTLVFDLDKNLPVSVEAEQLEAISFGDNAIEQIVEIESTFSPVE